MRPSASTWCTGPRAGAGTDVSDAVLADQVDALEAQLALLQSTTADLVSSDDIDEVLARIVTSAGRSVSAPGYLLALYDTVEVTDRVHADGIDAADLDARGRRGARRPARRRDRAAS